MGQIRNDNDRHAGVTRRGFITSVGTGAIGAAAVGSLAAAAPPEKGTDAVEAGALTRLSITVNGRRHQLLVEPRWSLLYVIRERLGLTGAKASCERGECGGCTVLVDDKPRYACLTLAIEADGSAITTVEGLMEGEQLGPVQRAFVEHDAFQCGYCTSGQVMAVEGLLRTTPHPTREQLRDGVSGNLCRCGSYAHILAAAERAAALKREETEP